MRRNGFTSGAGTSLGAMLAANSALKQLLLGENPLEEAGAAPIAEALGTAAPDGISSKFGTRDDEWTKLLVYFASRVSENITCKVVFKIDAQSWAELAVSV